MNKKKEEAQFWNLVSEKHNNTKEILEKECYERYLGMTKKSVEQRLVLEKILKILGIENSQQHIIFDDKNFRIIVDVLKPLENEIRTTFGLRAYRKDLTEFIPKHAQDLLNSMFESWSGASFKAINEKKIQVNKKRDRIFDYELCPIFLEEFNLNIWDIITDKYIYENIIIEKPKNIIKSIDNYEHTKTSNKKVKYTKKIKQNKSKRGKPINQLLFKNKISNYFKLKQIVIKNINKNIINKLIQQKLKIGVKLTVKGFKNKTK
jgi:hypothetical protein